VPSHWLRALPRFVLDRFGAALPGQRWLRRDRPGQRNRPCRRNGGSPRSVSRKLRLARDCRAGTIPLVTPDYLGAARQVLGDQPALVIDQMLVADTNPARLAVSGWLGYAGNWPLTELRLRALVPLGLNSTPGRPLIVSFPGKIRHLPGGRQGR
jgi:ribosomal protein S14